MFEGVILDIFARKVYAIISPAENAESLDTGLTFYKQSHAVYQHFPPGVDFQRQYTLADPRTENLARMSVPIEKPDFSALRFHLRVQCITGHDNGRKAGVVTVVMQIRFSIVCLDINLRLRFRLYSKPPSDIFKQCALGTETVRTSRKGKVKIEPLSRREISCIESAGGRRIFRIRSLNRRGISRNVDVSAIRRLFPDIFITIADIFSPQRIPAVIAFPTQFHSRGGDALGQSRNIHDIGGAQDRGTERRIVYGKAPLLSDFFKAAEHAQNRAQVSRVTIGIESAVIGDFQRLFKISFPVQQRHDHNCRIGNNMAVSTEFILPIMPTDIFETFLLRIFFPVKTDNISRHFRIVAVEGNRRKRRGQNFFYAACRKGGRYTRRHEPTAVNAIPVVGNA